MNPLSLKDPYDDGDEEWAEWLGDWEPEAFDLATVAAGFDR